MIFSQETYPLLCLYSLAVGASLGVVYDIIRVARIAFGPSEMPEAARAKIMGLPAKLYGTLFNIFVFVTDILFALISAVVTAVFVYHVNDGQVRSFTLIFASVGFFAYYFTVGKLVIRCAGAIISAVRAVIVFTLKLTVIPLARLTQRLVKAFVRLCRELWLYVYSDMEKRRLLKMAGYGFGASVNMSNSIRNDNNCKSKSGSSKKESASSSRL